MLQLMAWLAMLLLWYSCNWCETMQRLFPENTDLNKVITRVKYNRACYQTLSDLQHNITRLLYGDCSHLTLGPADYSQTSNISRTKSQNLNVYRLVLQLSLPNSSKPGVQWRMKMLLEHRPQAMLQLHLISQQCNYLLRCVLYSRFYGTSNYRGAEDWHK